MTSHFLKHPLANLIAGVVGNYIVFNASLIGLREQIHQAKSTLDEVAESLTRQEALFVEVFARELDEASRSGSGKHVKRRGGTCE